MPDDRRLFRGGLRLALYLRADGRCEICGNPLDPGDWHADHFIPHAQGGATQVENGMALCPTCHHDKTASERSNQN